MVIVWLREMWPLIRPAGVFSPQAGEGDVRRASCLKFTPYGLAGGVPSPRVRGEGQGEGQMLAIGLTA
ncbi:hypothetical protein B9J07_06705 [Sinorhizobium sp. LM21]|nr:hypothetical protein B9J07_06705 [Sinorhizobium sp. LM21]